MRPAFYFDLASAECYLVAERINSTLPEVPVWQPVRVGGLDEGGAENETVSSRPPSPAHRAELERRAAAHNLPPLRLPDPWPTDVELAMRAATFAQASGRVVAFSLAALRQAFAAGRDLSEVDNVLIAAAACELHPRAVLKGVESRSVAERLRAATEAAAADGVRAVPAIGAAGRVFDGPDAVERAAEALSD